jgi:hypothetical protein
MADHGVVVSLAWEVHQAHWRMSGDESEGDNLARVITETWQKRLQEAVPNRFAIEYYIAPHLKERIDVVDLVNGVAYELKASPNNVHFEFYRDIFKVILARDNQLPSLKRFVFLTPEESAAKLRKGMGKAVMQDSEHLGLTIEVIGLGPPSATKSAPDSGAAEIAALEKRISELQRLLEARQR